MKHSQNKKIAGLWLITVFSGATGLGFIADHAPILPHLVRRTTPDDRVQLRKPDGHFDSERSTEQTLPAPIRPSSPKPATSDLVVAIIDTGIDLTHPDLKDNAWINDGETGLDEQGRDKATNGIDDDGNGYVDDVHGFDFAGRRGEVIDSHGHGTHIAGIVLKDAPHARIMNLKYFNRGIDGQQALRNSLEAMRYAIKMKADVINYSGGGTIANPEELAILRLASRRGILVVAAAGNESTDSERQPFYPANYRLPNILSVTATDDDAEILPTSNFGVRSVAMAAVGKDVRSSLPGGRHGRMTGTSQATAVVTGAAVQVMMKAKRNGRDLSPEEVIERLIVSSRANPALKGKTKLGSTLEATRALKYQTSSSQSGRRDLLSALEDELGGMKVTARIAP